MYTVLYIAVNVFTLYCASWSYDHKIEYYYYSCRKRKYKSKIHTFSYRNSL